MTEEWRDIPGYEGYYQASSLGRVRSLDRVVPTARGGGRRLPGKILSASGKNSHYPMVNLCKFGRAKSYAVHQLVALCFLGLRPDGMLVCHWDGDSFNNSVENLRYDTPTENGLDSVRHGTHPETKKTRCKNAHAFDKENTVFRKKPSGRFQRECKICMSRYRSIYNAKARDSKLNPQEKKALDRA